MDQESTFLGCKKEALEKTLFEGPPSTDLEAQSAFWEALLGASWAQVGIGWKAKNDEIALVFVGFQQLGAFRERLQEGSEDTGLWKASWDALGSLLEASRDPFWRPSWVPKPKEEGSKK